jgi:hypothetical protein
VPLRMHTLHIFSYNLPAGTLSSVLKFNLLLKFCVKILLCKHYFSLLNTFMRKGKGPDPESNPGGPETCKSADPDAQHWKKKH